VALNPHSEQPDLGAPTDYAAHHPQEHPEDWGWHGEWGRAARIGGWLVSIVLIVMLTTTHYNRQGDIWLWGFTGFMVLMLIWDTHRRRNAWRK
jgi:predicted cobalt transporter CbtA